MTQTIYDDANDKFELSQSLSQKSKECKRRDNATGANESFCVSNFGLGIGTKCQMTELRLVPVSNSVQWVHVRLCDLCMRVKCRRISFKNKVPAEKYPKVFFSKKFGLLQVLQETCTDLEDQVGKLEQNLRCLDMF